MKKITAFLFVFILFSNQVFADEYVTLKNGDKISGRIISRDAGNVVIETLSMGTVNISGLYIDEVMTDAEIQRQKIEELKKQSAEKNWNGKLSFGVDRKSGNTESAELFGEAEFKRDGEKTTQEAKWRSFYSSEDKKQNELKHYAKLRQAWKLGERWINFYQLEYDTDKFANIHYRLLPSAGFGYYWFKNEDRQLLTELALGYTHTEFRDNTQAVDELSLIPRLYFETKILDYATLSEEFTLYPSLTENGEYRLKSETVFKAPLVKNLDLEFKFIDEYNSMPGGTSKKNDMRMISGLAYSF